MFKRTKVKRMRPTVIPRFSMSDFGIGPIQKVSNGRTIFRCDSCKQYREDVTISPGDGYAECGDCYIKQLMDAGLLPTDHPLFVDVWW